MRSFQEVDPKKKVDASEKEILSFWEREKIFQRSLKLREGSERYSFYDGPPFATGTPHYGHLEQSLLKDVVPRYWTMRGKYVERRWGWDCHGLPIENIVEKEMGSQSKKDIEAMGIEEFNGRCRSNIKGYVDEWKRVISRIGRWADMDDAYWTMDPEYMESVWWVFKTLWDKGLVYEGYRSMHICPRCETTLSQSEVAEGYKEVKDLSVVAKFRLDPEQKIGNFVTDDNTYILAWTTTPWTLMGNVALAVGKEIVYASLRVKGTSELLIVARDRIKEIFQDQDIEIVHDGIAGADLVGLEYEALFDEYARNEKLENRENGWKVYGADFVTTEEGTGVVHIAPAFGADDMNLGKEKNLPFIQHIGMDGIFKSETGELSGIDVKPRAKDKPEEVREADITILKKLKEKNAYSTHEKYLHSYPHCWRCDTALLNYATSSWFVKVEELKEKALEAAKGIHWVPGHIKEGRFGKWLEGARDWSISRQRFWASALPVWKCDACDHVKAVGSVMEISEALGGVNRLYLVRHGEAQSNAKKFLDSKGDPENVLTDRGREQMKSVAQELEDKKIDILICSPLARTRESAEILRQALDIEIIEDDRVREIGNGFLDGQAEDVLRVPFPTVIDQAGGALPEGVETYTQLRARVNDFLEDINKRYQGKNIVVVAHADPIFLVHGIIKDLTDDEMRNGWYPDNGEMRSVFSKTVDLHRPYIDEVKWGCKCGGTMTRIPDVLDTWFDSGSMPYAQIHYPFENVKKFQTSFPADFIGEMVEQTRSWFYYLHILATATRGSHAFRNVVADGTILAEDGKKMSKKLKNYPDPSIIMEKYGSDVLRVYLLSSPLFSAENLNFSEKELSEISRGMFRMLRNTYAFFVMYANVDGWELNNTQQIESDKKNLLDRWIVSEFQLLVKNVNEAMERYELARATRYFFPFFDDLSNWYVRRSRKRFWKSDNDGDKEEAYETLYFVLVELSKLLAPFAPFIAEEIYRNLTNNKQQVTRGSKYRESVHLCDYPHFSADLIDEKLSREMSNVRDIISKGLELRSSEGVKVRQPLAKLQVIGEKLQEEMEEIIKEELNVKDISYGEKVELDTNITPELKLEGQARELVRTIQEMRKRAGYNVEDRIVLGYQGMNEVFEEFGESIIAKETLATEIKRGKLEMSDVKKELEIDGESVKIAMVKVTG